MKIIVSIAEKGGVGKTTIATLVSVAAAKAGKRVLVVVADIQSGAAGILAPEAVKAGGTAQFLLGQSPTPAVGYLGIHVFAGGSDLDSAEIRDIRQDELRFNLVAIKDSYDFVIVDCAPVLRHLHRMVLDAADIALVVADQSREGLLGLSRVLSEIEKSKTRGAHAPSKTVVVANRANGRSSHDQVVTKMISEFADKFKAASVIIPTTTAIPTALDTRRPERAFSGNPAAEALAKLVTLCGI